MTPELERRLATLVDREEIFDLARRERFARDLQDFETMRDCFHADAYIRSSWFAGGYADEYVEATRERMKKSATSRHWVFPADLKIVGDRATLESPATIFDRIKLEGVDVDFYVFCRFFSRVERREGVWRLLSFEVIFEKDVLACVNPEQALPINWDKLANYRPSYRFLGYIQESRGHTVSHDLYGDDRQDSLLAFYARERQWLQQQGVEADRHVEGGPPIEENIQEQPRSATGEFT